MKSDGYLVNSLSLGQAVKYRSLKGSQDNSLTKRFDERALTVLCQ